MGGCCVVIALDVSFQCFHKKKTLLFLFPHRFNYLLFYLAITLADDLVLARLSSLLLKSTSSFIGDSRDLKCRSSDKIASNNAADATIPALSIVHDLSLIVPTALSVSSFAQGYSTDAAPMSSIAYCQEAHKISAHRRPSNPVANLLKNIGIEEVETLSQHPTGPTSGQCQFSCVAMALSKESSDALHFNNRPDLELRKLALHTIASNPDMYADFLMNAAVGRRTRSISRVASEVGGRSVDLDNYLRNMSNPACDGDAITLQALCDSLKITIRIVKPVKADAYQKEWQQEKLAEYINVTSRCGHNQSIAHLIDASSAESEESGGGLCETETSISTCARCDSSTWSNSDDNTEDDGIDLSGMEKMQRLYISHELQPRSLQSIDARIKDVQRVTRGRLVWLSHIGDEAHYRFLRPMKLPSRNSLSSIAEAQLSRSFRVSRLRNVCTLVDGYKRPKFRLCGMSVEPPCCALCLEQFNISVLHKVVSPSSCCHHYHLECLVAWNGAASNNCPSCLSLFSEIYFVSNEENSISGYIPASSFMRESDSEGREEGETATRSDGDSIISSPWNDVFSHSSFDDVFDWINSNKYGVDSMNDRLDTSNISALVERLLVLANSNPSDSKDSENMVEDLSKMLSVELFQNQTPSCHILTSLLDAGFLSVLRVLLAQRVFKEDLFEARLHKGVLEILQLLMHFTSQGLFLTRCHLQNSGGLLKLLLRILDKYATGQTGLIDEGAVNVVLKILCCCCRFAIPLPPAFSIAGGIPSAVAGPCHNKQNGTFNATSLHFSNGRLHDECISGPIRRGCRGKKRLSSVSSKNKNKAASKKRKLGTTVKKDRVNRLLKRADPPTPAHLLSQPVLKRAPGKRQIKPVATTNISHEHLGLRCYRGAL